MDYSTRRFALSLAGCSFLLVFFSSLSIATLLGEVRANLDAFVYLNDLRLFCFVLFSLSLGVWEGLRLVIVALPGLSLLPFMQSVCM